MNLSSSVSSVFVARVLCDGQDFQLAQRESGHPLFRPESNDTYKSLLAWLDEFPAEPVGSAEVAAEGKSGPVIGYYVHLAQKGPRRAEVPCRLLEPEELGLRGKRIPGLRDKSKWVAVELNRQLALLKERDDGSELHAEAVARLSALTTAIEGEDEQVKRNCGQQLLTYQGDDGRPRLLWCWAHERSRADPTWADTYLCDHCRRLFLVRCRERGRTVTCPTCGWQKDTGTGWRKAVAACLLLLLLAVVLWGFGGGRKETLEPVVENGPPPPPVAALTFDPEHWEVPVGAVIQPRLFATAEDGERREVSEQAVVYYQDPELVSRLAGGVGAQAVVPGRTRLTAYFGGDSAQGTVVIQPSVTPERLRIEPTEVTLGIGATERFRVFGVGEAGEEFELTPSVEWRSDDDQTLFLYRGLAEGLRAGQTVVQARYRASREHAYEVVEAAVTVSPAEFVGLELVVEPATVQVGKRARLFVQGRTADAREFSLLDSSRLRMRVEPPEAASLDGEFLIADGAGEGLVIATLDDLQETAKFTVLGVTEADRPEARDRPPITLAVGQSQRVTSADARRDLPPPESSAPEVVQVLPDGRISGRSPGSADVIVHRNEQERETVRVRVRELSLDAVRIQPNPAVVVVDGEIHLAVYGRPAGEDEFRIRLAADQLDWPTLPDPRLVEFDPAEVRLVGKQPTGSSPLAVTVRYQSLEDTARIEVKSPPFQLVLEPEGPLALPQGQTIRLEPWVVYAGGRRVAVEPDRLEWLPVWHSGSQETLAFVAGQATAKGGETTQLAVRANYLNRESNEVMIRSEPVDPELVLQLIADPESMRIQETGRLTVNARDQDNREVDVDPSQLRFASSDPTVVIVEEDGGGYRALAAGEATLTVELPAAESPARVTVTVGVREQPSPLVLPERLTITSPEGGDLLLPVGARFRAYEVRAHYPDGTDRQVTADVSLQVQSDQEPLPLTVRDGVLWALSPGTAVVTASLGDRQTSNSLQVTVEDHVAIERIEVLPEELELTVGQHASLRAFGYSEKGAHGEITAMAELRWKSRDEDVVVVAGPQVSALTEGQGGVTAQLGSTISNVAEVRVTQQPLVADRLTVQPAELEMRSGQSAVLGRDVRVWLGTRDVSEHCDVETLTPEIVAYQAESRSLDAGRPARGAVRFTYHGQTARMEVRVQPAPPPSEFTLEISPAEDVLVVGQAMPIRVFQVFSDGERIDRTGAAVIRSSDPEVLEIVGRRAIARQAGQCHVAAVLPESPELRGRATFRVLESEYEEWRVAPARLELVVDQEANITLTAAAAGQRHVLNEHRSAQFSIEGSAASVSTRGAVVGRLPGEAVVRVRWEGAELAQIPVVVREETGLGIAVEPLQQTLRVGESYRYEVFLIHEQGRRRLEPEQGVSLTVADTTVAELADPMRVRAQSPGRTQITARYGEHHATSNLQVLPGEPAPPPAQPMALRFSRATLEMSQGSSATAPVHVVLADDSTRDVSSQVLLSLEEETDVVRVDSSGPRIRAVKTGVARIHAELDDLTTTTPLLVEVAKDGQPEDYRLVVSPGRFRMYPGQTEEFGRVVVQTSGRAPTSVAYQLNSAEEGVARVVGGGSIQGVAPGQTHVQVVVVAPDRPYDGLSLPVSVDVLEKLEPTPDRQLILRGPTEITAGQTAAFEASVVQGSRSRPVTHDHTFLIVTGPNGSAPGAVVDVLSGSRILGKQPGTVGIRARHGDLVSNSLTLRVVSPTGDYDRLILVLDERPMHVGESRAYQVRGQPAGDAIPHELTHLVSEQAEEGLVTVSLSGAATAHHPPVIVAEEPGFITVQARLGELKSDTRKLSVVEAPSQPPQQLRLEPPSLTLRLGSDTPPLSVWLRHVGAEQETRVDAVLRSLDPAILEPQEEPNRFRAVGLGNTVVEAVYSGVTARCEVQVVGNRFLSVVHSNYRSEERGFYVDYEIEAAKEEGPLEYRVVRTGGLREEASPWTSATAEEERWIVKLPSPRFPHGADSYQAIIQARDSQGRVQSYPHSFRVTILDWPQDESN